MKKMQKEKNILPFIILGVEIVAILLFIVFPVAWVGSLWNSGIEGFKAVFGGTVKLYDRVLQFNWNWLGTVIIVLSLISGACSGFLAKKQRGWLVFSIILQLFVIVVSLTFHSSWINLAASIPTSIQQNLEIGFGGAIMAALSGVGIILNGIQFKLSKI